MRRVSVSQTWSASASCAPRWSGSGWCDQGCARTGPIFAVIYPLPVARDVRQQMPAPSLNRMPTMGAPALGVFCASTAWRAGMRRFDQRLLWGGRRSACRSPRGDRAPWAGRLSRATRAMPHAQASVDLAGACAPATNQRSHGGGEFIASRSASLRAALWPPALPSRHPAPVHAARPMRAISRHGLRPIKGDTRSGQARLSNPAMIATRSQHFSIRRTPP